MSNRWCSTLALLAVSCTGGKQNAPALRGAAMPETADACPSLVLALPDSRYGLCLEVRKGDNSATGVVVLSSSHWANHPDGSLLRLAEARAWVALGYRQLARGAASDAWESATTSLKLLEQVRMPELTNEINDGSLERS